MILVRVRHLPHESAVASLARDGGPAWSVEAHLLDDLRMAFVHSADHPAEPHPLRPQASATPVRSARQAAATPVHRALQVAEFKRRQAERLRAQQQD